MNVIITLKDDFDLSRGDMIVKPNNRPKTARSLDMVLCWLADRPMKSNDRFILKHTTNEVKAKIDRVLYKFDIENLSRIEGECDLKMNDIARVKVKCNRPIFMDAYEVNKKTGSILLIDEATHESVAAGLLH